MTKAVDVRAFVVTVVEPELVRNTFSLAFYCRTFSDQMINFEGQRIHPFDMKAQEIARQ